jgi:predicted lipoprotein
MTKYTWYYFVLILLAVSSCKDKEDTSIGTDFDKTAFLTNAADNIIVPAYATALSAARELKTATDLFTSDASQTNLSNLKNKWKAAFIAWQGASPFNFGPAEDGSYKTITEDLATFPTNTTKTDAYISNGDYSFDNFDRDTRGYAAIDYLINSGTDAEIITSFDSNKKAYLAAISDDIVDRIDNVHGLWIASYRDTFVSNTTTSAGGSISLYYNQFLISYEGNKSYKLAFPAGLAAGQSGVQTNLLEAYHGAISLDLIKAQFTATENIWYGKSTSGTDGSGFDDYLDAVEGTDLKAQTITSIDNVWSKINAIPEGSMVTTLNDDPSPIITTVEEMQKHTRYFKSDLSTKIGIAITFSDGDGD